jgi:hypothetical protein
MEKQKKYKIFSHTFKGSSEYGYTYEITFNKSLEHTGKMRGIEDGLNAYDKKEASQDFISSFKNVWFSLIRMILIRFK